MLFFSVTLLVQKSVRRGAPDRAPRKDHSESTKDMLKRESCDFTCSFFKFMDF